MGGKGKTTIAKVLYNQHSSQFEGSCFFAGVKENFKRSGPVVVQEELLSNIFSERNPRMYAFHRGFTVIKRRLCLKKVLIVLDDVDNLEQLEILGRYFDWFGLGSRVIVTTMDKH